MNHQKRRGQGRTVKLPVYGPRVQNPGYSTLYDTILTKILFGRPSGRPPLPTSWADEKVFIV